jgi:L-ascorbate metabolism protein UlaG (beta-lactamase superfamily)
MEKLSPRQISGGKMNLTFRWLGVAGLELKAGGQVLAIDPFFTRPSLFSMLRPVSPDDSLVTEKLPKCDYVLVTHAHYDHLMDVPLVLQQTGAVAYGSVNTCRLLRLLGIPGTQVHEIHIFDKLSLGAFKVEVIAGQHSQIPLGSMFNGQLKAGLHPPLHVQDYRMDVCLGYAIKVLGETLLVCAREPQPAGVLFAVAQEPTGYYLRLFKGVNPHTFIPIHWDNFTRPLTRPLRRLARPGRLQLWQLTRLARQSLPHVKVLIPQIFQEYTLGAEGFSPSGTS